MAGSVAAAPLVHLGLSGIQEHESAHKAADTVSENPIRNERNDQQQPVGRGQYVVPDPRHGGHPAELEGPPSGQDDPREEQSATRLVCPYETQQDQRRQPGSHRNRVAAVGEQEQESRTENECYLSHVLFSTSVLPTARLRRPAIAVSRTESITSVCPTQGKLGWTMNSDVMPWITAHRV